MNAVSAEPPAADGTGFGGGPIAAASPAGFDGWTTAVARQAFVFLATGARALERPHAGRSSRSPAAPARRANPEPGAPSSGLRRRARVDPRGRAGAARRGIHVALLIVDGIIASPKTAPMARSLPAEALVRQEDVAEAVRYLATQSPRGMTHELVITPAGDRWLP